MAVEIMTVMGYFHTVVLSAYLESLCFKDVSLFSK